MDAPFPEDMIRRIETFMEFEDSRPRGLDIYQDVFDTESFFPLQRQRELARMIQTARSINPSVVYEIGSDKGGGLYHWCKSIHTVTRVIACEIRGTPYSELFEKAFPWIDFLWIHGSSYHPNNLAAINEWLDGDTIDVVFIDGDKGAFYKDFNLILPKMSRPSIAFMHDIQDIVPGKSFANVQDDGFRTDEIIDITDSLEEMGRQRNGEPATSNHQHWLRHWKGESCGVGVIYVE